MFVNSWKRGVLILLFCSAFIPSYGQPPCGTPPCGPSDNACNGPNPPANCPNVPIGGIEYLIIMGLGFGAYKYKKSRV